MVGHEVENRRSEGAEGDVAAAPCAGVRRLRLRSFQVGAHWPREGAARARGEGRTGAGRTRGGPVLGRVRPPARCRPAPVRPAPGGRRDPGRGTASLLRPLPHMAGARGDGRTLPHLENRIPAMMAPGLRRLRTPLPRHRAFVPPPALPGGRPCGSPPSAVRPPVRSRAAGSTPPRSDGLRWPFFELPGLARRQPLRRGRVLKSLVKKTTSSQSEAFGAQTRL